MLGLLLATAPSLTILASADSSGTTELVSLASDGSLPNNAVEQSKVSADGRYVYFASSASNLVPNDTNNAEDIFVRDRLLGTTTRLDVDSSGNQAPGGASFNFDVSEGGRYLVFSSGFNSIGGIYVRDLQSGVTSLVFHNDFTGETADYPVVSGDGNWIAFWTQQPLAPYADNYSSIYLINRKTLALTRVSNGLGGTVANNISQNPDINYDGSRVVFTSFATNLVSNDTNGKQDVFVWDRNTDSTSLADVSSAGVQANADAMLPHISGDGNEVVFASAAKNLVSPATTYGNIYLHRIDTGTTTLLSTTPEGVQGNGGSGGSLGISEDGNYVMFGSNASNLIPNDTNSTTDIFVKNLEANTTTLVSLFPDGTQAKEQGSASISSDGQYVAFASNPPTPGTRLIYLDY